MDNILTLLGCGAITTIISWLLNRKSYNINVKKDSDNIFLNRIDFLEKRLDNLEKLVCFNKDCEHRL